MRSRREILELGLAFLASELALGCDEAPAETREPPAPVEPKKPVAPPAEYRGPIDPEWPPSHPEPLQVGLLASKLMRERLARGEPPFVDDVSIPEERRGLHVEAGKLGEFSYLEAILGRPKHPDDPMPLVVLLHGRGGKAQVPAGPFESDVPVRLFIPQAPDRLGDGHTWLAARTLDGEDQLLTRSLSARADQLQPSIEAFRELRPTLGKPSVVGFSQGGILTFTLATRFPRSYAAAFPIAGWLPPALYPSPKRDQKFPYVFAQHGGVDDVVPTARARETIRALRARGLRVDYREEAGVGHIVTPSMNAEVRKGLARIFEAFRDSVPSRARRPVGRLAAIIE